LEIEKSEISENNQKLEEKLNNIENEFDLQMKKYTKDIKNLEEINISLKEKNENLTNMNNIKRNLLIENDMKIKDINEYYKKKIDEIEKEMYLKQKIEDNLKEKLENLLEKEDNMNRDLNEIKIKHNEELNFLEKEKYQILQDNILNENKYKKMIKDLEVLIYKINLENFDLKENLDRIKRDKNSNLYDYNIYNPNPTMTMTKDDFNNNNTNNNINFNNNNTNNNRTNTDINRTEQRYLNTDERENNINYNNQITNHDNIINNFIKQNEYSNLNLNYNNNNNQHIFNYIDIEKEIDDIEFNNNLKSTK
jgi:hypothetical protein